MMTVKKSLVQKEVLVADKKIATIEEWTGKANQTFQLDLPSGISIIAKKLDLIDLAISGYLPFDLISKAIKTAQELAIQKNWESISDNDLGKIGSMLDKIVIRAVVEPSIDESLLGSISFVDKFFIFGHTIDVKGAEILLPFRRE